MNPILKNAVLSIRIGTEDYQEDTDGRYISAIRNIYSGILLLYKYKLCELSPTSDPKLLISSKLSTCIGADGKAKFRSTGNKTIGSSEITKRLAELNIVIDSKRLETLQSLRNNIEHYYSEKPKEIIQEILSSAFLLISDFVTNHLNVNPSTLLKSDCWDVLLNVHDVYTNLQQSCQSSLTKLNWPKGTKEIFEHFTCTSCGSDLIMTKEGVYSPDIIIECAACGSIYEYGNIVETFVKSAYDQYDYRAHKDGGEPEISTCPECGLNTYINSLGNCLYCEYKLRYPECETCGTSLSVEEQDFRGLCSYHNHQRDKERDE